MAEQTKVMLFLPKYDELEDPGGQDILVTQNAKKRWRKSQKVRMFMRIIEGSLTES